MQDYRIPEIRQHIPEGSTMIFEGPQRVGKTLAMVIWALDAFQSGRKIFSNIQLGFPHEPLEFSEMRLEDGASKFWNGHITIDELNFYYDARRSMKPINIEGGAFILQQKKQGCNVTGTTHDLMSLDLRLRNAYDYLVTPTVYPKFPEVPQVIKMVLENGPTQPRIRKTFFLEARRFLGLYDSFAVYDPFRNREPKSRKESIQIEKRVKLV